jgi:hypothetical protein
MTVVLRLQAWVLVVHHLLHLVILVLIEDMFSLSTLSIFKGLQAASCILHRAVDLSSAVPRSLAHHRHGVGF